MDQDRLTTVFQLLQLFFYFYIIHREERDHENQLSYLESSLLQFDIDNDEDLLSALSALHPQARRIWMKVRSTHWIRNVLNGVLLQGGQFDDNFRMSRDSFEHLHALLGISESYSYG